jgi:hypothetical protein
MNLFLCRLFVVLATASSIQTALAQGITGQTHSLIKKHYLDDQTTPANKTPSNNRDDFSFADHLTNFRIEPKSGKQFNRPQASNSYVMEATPAEGNPCSKLTLATEPLSTKSIEELNWWRATIVYVSTGNPKRLSARDLEKYNLQTEVRSRADTLVSLLVEPVSGEILSTEAVSNLMECCKTTGTCGDVVVYKSYVIQRSVRELYVPEVDEATGKKILTLEPRALARWMTARDRTQHSLDYRRPTFFETLNLPRGNPSQSSFDVYATPQHLDCNPYTAASAKTINLRASGAVVASKNFKLEVSSADMKVSPPLCALDEASSPPILACNISLELPQCDQLQNSTEEPEPFTILVKPRLQFNQASIDIPAKKMSLYVSSRSFVAPEIQTRSLTDTARPNGFSGEICISNASRLALPRMYYLSGEPKNIDPRNVRVERSSGDECIFLTGSVDGDVCSSGFAKQFFNQQPKFTLANKIMVTQERRGNRTFFVFDPVELSVGFSCAPQADTSGGSPTGTMPVTTQ